MDSPNQKSKPISASTNQHVNMKIVGHSLGGGTAGLLTYILREQQDFASATCVAFAPAACMTWELAESGVQFITSVINGADLVPNFSAASVDDLRTEVTASAWLNDLRNQIEHKRILSTVYRSASALGSRLPSIANARARVAGAGAILRPVSTRTQVVMTRAKTMAQAAWTRPSLQIPSWTCIGPRRRNVSSAPDTSSILNNNIDATTSEPLVTVTESTTTTIETTTQVLQSETVESTVQTECSSFVEETTASHEAEIEEDEDEEMNTDGEAELTEVELWQQLESELSKPREERETDEEEEEESDVAREIAEASIGAEESIAASSDTYSETKEMHRFYPPGKIMHIVRFPCEEILSEEAVSVDCANNGGVKEEGIKMGIYLRSLSGKLRLSKDMINDHYMPIYRKNIEQLIGLMDKAVCSVNGEESADSAEVGL
ncbi:hypothetical protein LUZ60_013291 [Juncus effusus]|nr:hypothetical protein LUZ60_013291 [Juncus effusus]